MKTWVRVPCAPQAQLLDRQHLILCIILLYGVPAIGLPIKWEWYAHGVHQVLDARDGGPRESLDSFSGMVPLQLG